MMVTMFPQPSMVETKNWRKEDDDRFVGSGQKNDPAGVTAAHRKTPSHVLSVSLSTCLVNAQNHADMTMGFIGFLGTLPENHDASPEV